MLPSGLIPKVTVSLQTYNRPAFLKQAIEAVLAQTYADFEFLICDNGSDSETVHVIQSFSDARIRHVRNEINNREFANTPFAIAQGEYLLITHDDDQMHPELVAREVAELDAYPQCVAVGCNVNWIDEKGGIISKHHLPIQETVIMRQYEYLKHYQQGLVLYHPTVMMRKAFFNDNGLKYEYRVGPGADTYLWFSALKHPVELRIINDVLFSYRIHSSQGSTVHSLTMDIQLFEAILEDCRKDPALTKEAQRAIKQLLYFYFGMRNRNSISKQEYRRKLGCLSSYNLNNKLKGKIFIYRNFHGLIQFSKKG